MTRTNDPPAAKVCWSKATLLPALAIIILVVCARLQGWLEPLERNGYDILVQIRGELPADGRVALVDVDDPTLAWLGRQPPIPRRFTAEIVDRVSRGGAEIILLDALLSERQSPEDDAALIKSVERAGNVILAYMIESAGTSRLEPLPEFAQAALDRGYANFPIDSDGFVRRASLIENAPAVKDFSLAAAAVTNFLGKPMEFDAATGRFHLAGKPLRGPTKARPEIYVNYRGYAYHFDTVSGRDLLNEEPNAGRFDKKIVIIGQSFTQAPDLFQTPFFKPLFFLPTKSHAARLMPGMEIHANAIATLLNNESILPVQTGTQLALDFLCLLTALFAVMCFPPARAITSVAILIVLALAGSLWGFSHAAIWNRYVLEEVGIVLLAGIVLTARYSEERLARKLIAAERQKLMGMFEKYVSAEVAGQIWEHRDEIMLQGQEIKATILFSDIRSFTAMSEGKPPREILSLLNSYFEVMNSIVKAHRGLVNKYIGDGLMVLFGVPLVEDERACAQRAVLVALAMLEQVHARQADGSWPFSIGIGIHTGVVSAGNIGAHDRMEYSVIGEAVNLASRLEGLNKEYRTQLIISGQTRALVSDVFMTRQLGMAAVKGFQEPVPIYEVTGRNELAADFRG